MGSYPVLGTECALAGPAGQRHAGSVRLPVNLRAVRNSRVDGAQSLGSLGAALLPHAHVIDCGGCLYPAPFYVPCHDVARPWNRMVGVETSVVPGSGTVERGRRRTSRRSRPATRQSVVRVMTVSPAWAGC